METFAAYLIKSVIWLTGFALVYFLFLRNERYFRLKRFYLIAGLVFSFIFPLITVHYKIELSAPEEVHSGITTVFGGQASEVRTLDLAKPLDVKSILLLIYLSGIIYLTSGMIRQLLLINNTIRKSDRVRVDGVNVIKAPGFRSSFSFFNFVFINPSLDDTEKKVIMNHELVHVNQFHWVDLLLVEALCVFQWINPFAWIYTRFIRQNHEFIADMVALQQMSDPATYKAVLVNQLLETKIFSFSHSFNYSLNKKRFEMMKMIVSSPYRKMKILLIVPVLAFVFYAFARPEYRYPDQSGNIIADDQTSVNTGKAGPGSKDLITPESSSGSQEQVKLSGYSIAEPTPAESAQANQRSVRGVILDAEEKPLEGVSVTGIGSGGNLTFVTTGSDGRFELKNVPDDVRLLFSCPGYKRLGLDPDFAGEMTVHLETDPDYKQPAPQVFKRPEPLVVIDGKISDQKYPEVIRALGYDFGTMKMLAGKEATDKYGDKGSNGVAEILTRKKALELGLNPPLPRLGPGDYPTFEGKSYTQFNSWVLDRVRYPSEAQKTMVEGYVTINFIIEPDGTISDIRPSGTANSVLIDEVSRVIKSSPVWDPPKNPEIKEPFNMSVTVGFKLPDQILRQIPYVVVEEMPQYPGGEKALLEFLKENTKYPESAKAQKIEGRVIVRFVVNTDGNADALSVIKGVDPALDEEALRVVGMLKGFKPGMQGGKPVSVWYMVPVNFSLPVN